MDNSDTANAISGRVHMAKYKNDPEASKHFPRPTEDTYFWKNQFVACRCRDWMSISHAEAFQNIFRVLTLVARQGLIGPVSADFPTEAVFDWSQMCNIVFGL